jgi:hypothetical protein
VYRREGLTLQQPYIHPIKNKKKKKKK